MKYFAYGSNMFFNQVWKRVGDFKVLGSGILIDYELKFNKKSTDGSGKANIINNSGSEVQGIIFEFTDSQFQAMGNSEKGYHELHDLKVEFQANIIIASTFIANDDKVDNSLYPTAKYLNKITMGAEDFVTEEYLEILKRYQTKD